MDNLIRSTEEYKKEREMVVAVSTLIAVVIIAAAILIPFLIKYADEFISGGVIILICSPFIICVLLGLLTLYIHYYNRELGNTVIMEREIHGSRGGGHRVEKTTLLDVVFTGFVLLCILIIAALIIIYLLGTCIAFGPVGPITAPFFLILMAFSWIADLFKVSRTNSVTPQN